MRKATEAQGHAAEARAEAARCAAAAEAESSARQRTAKQLERAEDAVTREAAGRAQAVRERDSLAALCERSDRARLEAE